MLFRGRVCFVILNLYPYNNGHLMVVPNRHVANLATLTRGRAGGADAAHAPRGDRARPRPTRRRASTSASISGRPAGAGVLDHLHVHLVPRWNGDTNFMTAIGNTRVLPEELGESARKLRPIFERLADDV